MFSPYIRESTAKGCQGEFQGNRLSNPYPPEFQPILSNLLVRKLLMILDHQSPRSEPNLGRISDWNWPPENIDNVNNAPLTLGTWYPVTPRC